MSDKKEKKSFMTLIFSGNDSKLFIFVADAIATCDNPYATNECLEAFGS